MWDLRKNEVLRQAQWATEKKDLTTIYSLTLMKPNKDIILACGATPTIPNLLFSAAIDPAQ